MGKREAEATGEQAASQANLKHNTWAGVKSNEGRASLSLLCAHTQESPLPSHAADPATTSAVTR